MILSWSSYSLYQVSEQLFMTVRGIGLLGHRKDFATGRSGEQPLHLVAEFGPGGGSGTHSRPLCIKYAGWKGKVS